MLKKLKSHQFLVGLLLVLFFVLLRGIFYYNHLQGREVYFYSDNAIYAILAQRFLDGDILGAFNPYWNSGFPLATIPFYLLSGKWETAQIMLSMVSHLLLILVIYLTLYKISKSLAILSSFLVAFSNGFGKLVMVWGITEPFYVLLYWLAIYFGWRAINTKRMREFAIAGLFFGLAYLTRTEVIYSLGIFLIIASGVFLVRKKKKLSITKLSIFFLIAAAVPYIYFRSTRGIFFALIFIGIFIVTIIFEHKKNFFLEVKKLVPKMWILFVMFLLVNLPYVAAISTNLGKPTLSGKYAFLKSGPAFKLEPRRYATFAQDVWSIHFPNYKSPYYETDDLYGRIWHTFDSALDATWKRGNESIRFYAYGNIYSNPEAMVAVLGMLLIPYVSFGQFLIYLIVIWLGSFVAISHFMDIAYRYLGFSYSFFHIMQATAVLTIANGISKRTNKLVFPLILLLFVFFYFKDNIDTRSFFSISKTGGSSDQKVMGDYLKSKNIKLFMGRTEAISFYADAKMVYVPAADPETIVQYAKAWGVPYILSRPAESSWVYMKEIVNPELNHPDLTLEHEFYEGTLLWKVNLTEDEIENNLSTGTIILRDSSEVF